MQYECARISHLCIHKHKHLESNLEEAEEDIENLSAECNNLNNENERHSKKVNDDFTICLHHLGLKIVGIINIDTKLIV